MKFIQYAICFTFYMTYIYSTETWFIFITEFRFMVNKQSQTNLFFYWKPLFELIYGEIFTKKTYRFTSFLTKSIRKKVWEQYLWYLWISDQWPPPKPGVSHQHGKLSFTIFEILRIICKKYILVFTQKAHFCVKKK